MAQRAKRRPKKVAKRRPKKVAKTADRPSTPDPPWEALTWAELDRWAGPRTVSRGRDYQRRGRVKELARTPAGDLLATVEGGARYITTVRLTGSSRGKRQLASLCSCPVGVNCKHAVAVVGTYLDALAAGNPVPEADPYDRRLSKLGMAFDDGDEPRPGHAANGASHASSPAPTAARPRSQKQWAEKIDAHLRAMSHQQLVELVLSHTDRFPELHREFTEAISLAEGDFGRIIAQARSDIQELTEPFDGEGYWDDEDDVPDAGELRSRLEQLLEAGYCDAVLELGWTLIARGTSRVEIAGDNELAAMRLVECMPVVFKALKASNLPTKAKILWAIDASMNDPYDLTDDAIGCILDARWRRDDWSAVADELQQRLEAKKPRSGTGLRYDDQRYATVSWLARALEKAGREAELRQLYETEARASGTYERLVRYLLERGDDAAAETWALEGIEVKKERQWPGAVSQLVDLLCELARRRKDWPTVAAHAAQQFFNDPDAGSFKTLLSEAKRAKCLDAVRGKALAFLESGRCPIRAGRDGRLLTDPDWPLPVPDWLRPEAPDPERPRPRRREEGQPYHTVLIDIALMEKRLDDALHWLDALQAAKQQQKPARSVGYVSSSTIPWADRVAAAVATSRPERALAIYGVSLAESLKAADPSAYQRCTAYLRMMHPIYAALGREDQWHALLARIREEYRRRPRFIEMLDRLDPQPIVKTRRAKRRS